MGIIYYIYCDITNDIPSVAERGPSNNFIGYYMLDMSNN